jgi:uncharacterized membrane protein YdbT with pleckstrin-like domain
MTEEPIWKGHSSQWKNAGSYVLVLIALAVAIWLHQTQPDWGRWAYVVPAVFAIWALWKLLLIKSTTYTLTTERLVTTKGVLTKVTDTLELYRIRDLQIIQPFTLRVLGLENVHLLASDATTETFVLDYMPANLLLGEKLRKAVEDCREKKRVRSIESVTEDGHDGVSGGAIT